MLRQFLRLETQTFIVNYKAPLIISIYFRMHEKFPRCFREMKWDQRIFATLFGCSPPSLTLQKATRKIFIPGQPSDAYNLTFQAFFHVSVNEVKKMLNVGCFLL